MLTKNQENLKNSLQYGDVKQLVEMTGYSTSTVYQALRGKTRKPEIWNALAEIVRKRRKEDKKLDETIEKVIP